MRASVPVAAQVLHPQPVLPAVLLLAVPVLPAALAQLLLPQVAHRLVLHVPQVEWV